VSDRRPGFRFGLGASMAIIGIIGVGLGLMRNGSSEAASAGYGLLISVLSIGLLGAIIRRRGSWIGFAVFGWIHAAFTLGTVDNPHFLPNIPTVGLADKIAAKIAAKPILRAALPSQIQLWTHGYVVREGEDGIREPTAEEQKTIDEFEAWKTATADFDVHVIPRSQQTGYMTITLLVAVLGAMIGRLLERPRSPEAPAGGRAGLDLPATALTAGRALTYEN
jgi:hypothetical protein